MLKKTSKVILILNLILIFGPLVILFLVPEYAMLYFLFLPFPLIALVPTIIFYVIVNRDNEKVKELSKINRVAHYYWRHSLVRWGYVV
jgi:hypothetical protein